MKWYSIGSLSFPASWAAIAAALILAYIYLRLQGEKQAAELYSNAFFIFVLTWKLSVILFYFETTVKNPLSIVYFNGGIRGYWLGIAAGFLYLFFAGKKSAVNKLHVQVWIVVITIYELVFFLLNNGHILLSGFQIIGSILILLLTKKQSGNTVWSIQILILFICFQGLVYSMAGNLFSIQMMTYSAGALFLGWTAWKGCGTKQ
ncbi:hypothetical protein D4T97_003260 [Siminovitchia acidinfaciens]|uniref:Uncharacterized protein n=1 Tax=Siminovitchia acidinfaciens TaxID=2321395 RepID=A0A429Y7W1_9BACI|nr:hypothetical protein [Siminovitchia acidinfaciens]RST77515.1 hypothetical protein D4T97_003260 [Siminovitchia acidinfaciens]